MEDGNKESKRARTIGGVEVCVLDANRGEWLDEPGVLLEDQGGSKEDVDRMNVPEHIHRHRRDSPLNNNLTLRDLENRSTTIM